jgi:hypothetical protein
MANCPHLSLDPLTSRLPTSSLVLSGIKSLNLSQVSDIHRAGLQDSNVVLGGMVMNSEEAIIRRVKLQEVEPSKEMVRSQLHQQLQDARVELAQACTELGDLNTLLRDWVVEFEKQVTDMQQETLDLLNVLLGHFGPPQGLSHPSPSGSGAGNQNIEVDPGPEEPETKGYHTRSRGNNKRLRSMPNSDEQDEVDGVPDFDEGSVYDDTLRGGNCESDGSVGKQRTRRKKRSKR